MGFKTLKQQFGIEHIVHVVGDHIVLGSDFVSDLLRIEIATGDLIPSTVFSNFMEQHCPQLRISTKEQRLEAINAVDEFNDLKVVYCYKNGVIEEHYCEKYGYPNTTTTGILMHNNVFSHDLSSVVRWAKSDLDYEVEHFQRKVQEYQEDIAHANAKIKESTERLDLLVVNYPEAFVDVKHEEKN